jgi:hypothetical protein
MLVIIVQAAIWVREIDDKISALIFFVCFYEIFSFILVLCLGLWILSRRFLGSSIG